MEQKSVAQALAIAVAVAQSAMAPVAQKADHAGAATPVARAGTA